MFLFLGVAAIALYFNHRRPAYAAGAVWGLALLLMIWRLPVISPPLLWGSLLFPAYYVALSLYI